MKNQNLNLFVPPVGLIRSIPLKNRKEYLELYKSLGPITKHEYDLDICVLYRQMDDLRRVYKKFAGKPYNDYVTQIKDACAIELNNAGLNADFYLDHYYYVLRPDSPAYLSFISLFLALSDPLKVVPILEHHHALLSQDKIYHISNEEYLGNLEYLVCNFLRSNRFPEDWFAKHEKVMNWVYAKRQQTRSEQELNRKFELLINAINEASKLRVPKEVIQVIGGRKKGDIIRVKEEMVDILINDLKKFFGPSTFEDLKRILSGEANLSCMIIFLGQANQLIDVFRIYATDMNVTGDKRAIVHWLRNHFMVLSEKDYPIIMGSGAENVMYDVGLPPKNKRIELSNLKHKQGFYYGDKTP